MRARIVIVEDEPDLRDAVAEYLGANGYDVTQAGSAAEARALLETESYHLAILDIAMPGEDGYTLMRRLQKEVRDDARRRLPAVALTAHARVEDRIRALSSGFQSHVAKPVEPRELVAVVASLADRRGA